ncbi:unnamed protein product [Cuscuta campestris]|uniref:Uncharacterized protein n=1 Tax=Cuscuta campestris TaxID=132261 RepID=A0A484LYS3_9ASTE|nr:unnamed protein product [Cuscuta campestris]
MEHPEGIVEKVRCWNIEVNGLIVGTVVHRSRSIQNSGQQLSPNFRIKRFAISWRNDGDMLKIPQAVQL